MCKSHYFLTMFKIFKKNFDDFHKEDKTNLPDKEYNSTAKEKERGQTVNSELSVVSANRLYLYCLRYCSFSKKICFWFRVTEYFLRMDELGRRVKNKIFDFIKYLFLAVEYHILHFIFIVVFSVYILSSCVVLTSWISLARGFYELKSCIQINFSLCFRKTKEQVQIILVQIALFYEFAASTFSKFSCGCGFQMIKAFMFLYIHIFIYLNTKVFQYKRLDAKELC
ncbi:hypothetical protein Anas_11807, partial [Armadillidium nasatum]